MSMTTRNEKGQWLPGGSPGRPQGSKNKLQGDFLEALAKDFAEHGEGVIRIVRVEEPARYLQIVASLMPKDLNIDAEISAPTLAYREWLGWMGAVRIGQGPDDVKQLEATSTAVPAVPLAPSRESRSALPPSATPRESPRAPVPRDTDMGHAYR
jgi:hypothetical protein